MGLGDADSEGPKLLEAVKPATAMHIWELDTQELAITARALSTLAAEDSELTRVTSSAAIGKA